MYNSGPVTPGVGVSLGFLNLPDLPGGIGTGGRDESTLSESLAKGSYSMGKEGSNAKRGGPALTTNADEIDEFDFLMQESFERKKKQVAKSSNGLAKNGDLTKSRQRIIEEPHQTTEYDVDDLINELEGQESWMKKLGK
jgi:hypothetical protein